MDSIPVLLVEDEALILTLAEDTLKEAGYAVSIASHGREAMRMLDSKDAVFRALVTDIDLDDPVTGWDLATEKKTPRSPSFSSRAAARASGRRAAFRTAF